MKKRIFLTSALASLALIACGQAPEEITGIPEKQLPTLQNAAANTKGFEVGSKVAAKTAYVFFDPQCPHCAKLWEVTAPLHNQVRFVWVPVGLLNKSSTPQGAALLSAQDPVQAMNQHEVSLLARQGGISASSTVSPELELAIKKNTKVLLSFGANSVPFLVATTAQGTPYSAAGVPSLTELAQILGVKPSV